MLGGAAWTRLVSSLSHIGRIGSSVNSNGLDSGVREQRGWNGGPWSQESPRLMVTRAAGVLMRQHRKRMRSFSRRGERREVDSNILFIYIYMMKLSVRASIP